LIMGNAIESNNKDNLTDPENLCSDGYSQRDSCYYEEVTKDSLNTSDLSNLAFEVSDFDDPGFAEDPTLSKFSPKGNLSREKVKFDEDQINEHNSQSMQDKDNFDSLSECKTKCEALETRCATFKDAVIA
jgi:hypothetical protein